MTNATPENAPVPAEPVQEADAVSQPEGAGAKTPITCIIDGLLGLTRFLKSRPALLGSYQKMLTTVGLYAILVCGLWFMIFNIVVTCRGGGGTPIFMGLIMGIVGAPVLHYIAAKFANAGRTIIKADAQNMASGAFLDCIGLLLLLGSLAALIYGIVLCIQVKQLTILWVAIIQFIIAFHLAVFSLNPKEALNIDVVSGGATAGETALAILSFVIRSVLGIAPILLGLGMAAMTVWMLVAMILSWTEKYGYSGMAQFGMSSTLAAAFALLPLASYLVYLFYMLWVDFYMAVIRCGRNTDIMAGNAKK